MAARHHRRHRTLVPGVHRARGRQRPGQPAHAGRRRRRRVRRQRHQDVDVDRAPGRVGPVPRANRPDRHRPRREARGHHRLIVDMELPGVGCNPIREITGEAMFYEVVFTDARIPSRYRLGEEGDGWNVAMGTLTHERAGTGGIAIGLRAELDADDPHGARAQPRRARRPGIRDRIARLHTQVELTRLLNARALSKVLKGERTWPEAPLAKLQWSHLSQALAELNVDMLGPDGRAGQGRARRHRRRPRRPQLPVAALHVDRRRHHRGAEEHHRRPRHQTAPTMTRRWILSCSCPSPSLARSRPRSSRSTTTWSNHRTCSRVGCPHSSRSGRRGSSRPAGPRGLGVRRQAPQPGRDERGRGRRPETVKVEPFRFDQMRPGC